MLFHTFQLRPDRLFCDADGLRFCGKPLLRRDAATHGSGKWRPHSQAEIERDLSRAYGLRVDAGAKLAGLQTVAEALNAGEVARAQIAALFLHLPDPALSKSSEDDGIVLKTELAHFGWIQKDWNPDEHPRAGVPPNPGWFAPKDGADKPGREAPTAPARPSVGGTENHEQVAVLTKNFNYACRVLKLDRNTASDLLHKLKDQLEIRGDDDCVFDTETGDVYFNGELIGNLLEP